MNRDKVRELNDLLKDKSAKEILAYFNDSYASGIVLASSLGAEDQVLTHLALQINPKWRIFVLDTGRLHQETYDVMAQTKEKYGMSYDVYFPLASDVEKMVSKKGPNSFYASIENRKECCGIRKVEPLKRALKNTVAWVTGLRREQSPTRSALMPVEWDATNELLKVNPLYNWKEDEVWSFIKANHIPYNALHDQGYPSIGCAPCTRAIKEGDDVRSGRWWWEDPDSKECGLHMVDGKLVRKNNPTELGEM